MLSVLILTKNEEHDLPSCLDSVAWSDDVHVYDSHSTDRTIEIAEGHGAKVTLRTFDNYAAQRNAALHGLAFAYPWVLVLDADERIPITLWEEIKKFIGSASATVSAARIRRRDFLYGTWLKHAQISPYYIRLVRPEKTHYERAVNEIVKVAGTIADLSEAFDHYPFSKGMRHWLDKHNTYSSMEASLIQAGRQEKLPFSVFDAFFEKDFNQRRYHQKELFYRLPFRPFVKFVLIYFFRLGLLDGRAGFTYAMLQSIYEYIIVLKTREIGQQTDMSRAQVPRAAPKR